ncbi:DEAD/DEAH box helicase domain-containing protein [Terracoccus luteus]|uniref:DEAD/DEAH box helicase domain-containing protein n=1 Tax=Terracoccus luteus TaxID=53356 RepID=A0A495XYQ0_9MICO|nr:DEAD/DEAH box helicase [Terracoccus luteus]RKT79072.1 DEAD/DEAH box helicase domain-containing protein [Terracoccus luteus]
MDRPDPATLLAALAGDDPGRVVHVHEVPARVATEATWPTWVEPTLLGALLGAGIERPWSHQVEVAEAAHEGRHVVVATGTASGKSLGYLLPALTDLAEGSRAPNGRGATALYLSPTKALAADQLTRVDALALPGVRAATYDGDTPTDERRWIRDHANLVLTNPDMLHHSVLPNHDRWASFLRALRYVVVDECHVYRGVFGAHLAAVLRRLRRVAGRYRSSPTFVFASATVADPDQHAGRLLGLPVHPVTVDGSPRGAMTFALWEPPLTTDAGGELHRTSTLTEVGSMLAGCVSRDVQTVAFARSRAGVEVVAGIARDRVSGTLEHRVAAYRGGYLPEERRELETDLRSRRLLGLAATNALELGVDVSGLDAVLLAGWPGTLASVWQQAGRAGRSGDPSLAVFVAADDPLDTFVVHHPESIFGRGVEAAVVDPDNPHVLAPHLAAAAAELPITEDDVDVFGPQARGLLEALVAAGILRRRPRGWFWGRDDRPSDHLSLRGAGEPVRIVETRTGRVVGTVDDAAAHAQVHTGAVHVHQGQSWVVTELDLEDRAAFAVRGDPGWSTQARSVSEFEIGRELEHEQWGPLRVSFGAVTVRSQVVSFLRRLPGGEVVGEHPLDLPVRSLATKAVWWTMPVDELAAAGVDEAGIPGAAHAAEHAAIGMLPLFATADRWDIGGVSTALHPDTGLPTILIYDGHPGGAGFAERGYRRLRQWLRATREAIAACECPSGCPSCIQSPKCGNGNEPLSKTGAVALLDLTLGHGERLVLPVDAAGRGAERTSGAGHPAR